MLWSQAVWPCSADWPPYYVRLQPCMQSPVVSAQSKPPAVLEQGSLTCWTARLAGRAQPACCTRRLLLHRRAAISFHACFAFLEDRRSGSFGRPSARRATDQTRALA